ncbi:GNAT family N-acetyltransferase [Streptomyces sp. URMC 124]|uniref:GNAT family N-acetyltransferase n=1 Tax=Streptomyces sp. URMC 124 TaxID=3423405 RepID=UPI003F1A86A6
MVIRRATAADAASLTALVRGSGAYRDGYEAMVEDYEVTADYIAAHEVFVAEGDDGALLGFYALLLGPPAELDLMFVADTAQGLGVGRRLATHMKTRAHAVGLTGVRVVSHPPSEGFYRSVGAHRTGTVRATGATTWDRPELVFALG